MPHIKKMISIGAVSILPGTPEEYGGQKKSQDWKAVAAFKKVLPTEFLPYSPSGAWKGHDRIRKNDTVRHSAR